MPLTCVHTELSKRVILTLLANRVDPDEMAHNEPSHLDLHCLPFRYSVFDF